jgi:hypothetical protein
MCRGTSVHHPGVTLQRHLLQRRHEARRVEVLGAAGLLVAGRGVGLRGGPEKAGATALLAIARSTPCLPTTSRTVAIVGLSVLLTPRIDANPWASGVGRTVLLLLLVAAAAAAALAKVGLLALLLPAVALLLPRLLVLHPKLLGRRGTGATGTCAAGRRGGGCGGDVEGSGLYHLALLSQPQFLEGEHVEGASEVHGGVTGADVAGGAEAGIGTTEEVEHRGGVVDGLADITKAINLSLHLLAIGLDGQVSLSQGHEGLAQEDGTRRLVRLEASGDGSPMPVCRRVGRHDEVMDSVGDGVVELGTDTIVLLEPNRREGIGRRRPVDVGQQLEGATQGFEAGLPLGEVVRAEVELHGDVGLHRDRGVGKRHGEIDLGSKNVVADQERKSDGVIGVAITGGGVHVGDRGHRRILHSRRRGDTRSCRALGQATAFGGCRGSGREGTKSGRPWTRDTM